MTNGRGIHGGSRRRISSKEKKRLRAALHRKYGNQCWYCQRHFPDGLLTIEHLIPRSQGGTNALTNLRLACEPCNAAEGRKTAVHRHPEPAFASRHIEKYWTYKEQQP
jgi:5-methylcytosine-specific restriction endonuclease McrA